MRWINSNPYPEVTDIFYKIDRSNKTIALSWNYDLQNVEKFLIYRADNGGSLKLYKAIEKDKREFIDQYDLSDMNIEYRIVVLFLSGERTSISKAMVVRI